MKIFFALCVTTLFLCTVKSHHSWWQSMSLYQIYPRSFMDSDGDGNGDLRGIINKLDYLADLKVDAFWLTPIYKSPMVDNGYDASNFTGINYMFGTMQDFENLVKRAHDYSMKVLMDCIPTYSSDQHEWFQKSVAGVEPYTDYYVWKEGQKDDGTMQPPNNWRSVFNGSAWTWNDKRQAFYLHQFTPSQPDLNYRNKDLVEEMKMQKHLLKLFLELLTCGILRGSRSSRPPSKFRDPERSPMQWNNSTSAGFSTYIKTWRPVNPNYKTLNLAFAKVSDDSYYNYYKALASLRNMHAVRSGNLQVKVLENDVLAFSRNKKKKKSVYVLINFSEQNKTVSLMEFENTDPELAFYRASPGLGLTSGSLMNSNEINIPPTATMVFVDS
ncbi:alpha-glucosidase-like [Belonocnema kinseyi]|uniref:alpha-glucosidase-like n=1 Tax=Belonocnema kinseyi TaxID=2817044 RepID=UPI00143D37BA|nr:alpha-glucosidase-like [Belonocnema kinseyi]